jgi:pilus assembly protein CpaE
MSEFAVVIAGHDEEQRALLRLLVEGTSVAKVRGQFDALPTSGGDLTLRRIGDLHPDVVMIDVPPHDPTPALRAIEHVHATLPTASVFAMGEMTQPQTIVAAMRAGAREYLDRTTSPSQLLEAFVRLSSSQMKARTGHKERGKVFTFVNAKGGCGSTTIAVNTALTIQSLHGNVALVDLAPLGHAALHLNARPSFTVADALRNVNRLDPSLLESYMVRHENGLHLLAGNTQPRDEEDAGEFARLFDLLVGHYKYVVVDASTRLDHTARVAAELSDSVLLVANTDVPSLWSAARVAERLSEGPARERIRLIFNRYRKVAGFHDEDAERATRARLLWKVPDQGQLMSAAIDRGIPVAQQNHSEIARSFVGLAGVLTETSGAARSRWSIFRGVA